MLNHMKRGKRLIMLTCKIMEKYLYIIFMLLLSCLACYDSEYDVPKASYIPEMDTSIAGSIVVEGYIVKNGSVSYGGKELSSVISPNEPMLLDISKKGDDIIDLSIVVCWNDTVVNLFSDSIQINGEPGYVAFDSLNVNANVRLNDEYEATLMIINGYIKNVAYSRLSLRLPEYECKLNIMSMFNGRALKIEINAIEPQY